MRIVLINLDRAGDRRQKMAEQFAAAQLDFEILPAFDGCKLTSCQRDLVDDDRRQATSAYVLSDNEIGCWLSHRKAMQTLLESDQDMMAILEDDASLTPEFGATLNAIKNHDQPFDFIFLHRQFRKGEIFAHSRTLMTGMQLGRIGYSNTGAMAYVVSREGARKFIAFAERIVHAVDKEIHRYWANGFDVYGLERPVVVSTGMPSYIDETREQARTRYCDADSVFWRLRRQLARMSESIVKRVAFGPYVRKGRRIV